MGSNNMFSFHYLGGSVLSEVEEGSGLTLLTFEATFRRPERANINKLKPDPS